MQAVAVIVLVVGLSPTATSGPVPEETDPETVAPTGTLVVQGLPGGARLEIDGEPVADPTAPVQLEPGTYLVTIFPLAAPPFERFVEIRAAAPLVLHYLPTALPGPRSRSYRVYGQLLVGSGALAGTLSAGWHLLAGGSLGAAQRIRIRTDLTEPERAAVLADLQSRERGRRRFARGAGVAAAVLTAFGGVLLVLDWFEGSGLSVHGEVGAGVFGAHIEVLLP